MWEKVKSSNPSLGVCEISAHIGRLWRELGPEDKQRHNHEYTLDKVPTCHLSIIHSLYILSCNTKHTVLLMTVNTVKSQLMYCVVYSFKPF